MSLFSDIGPFSIVPRWLERSGVSDKALRLYVVLGDYADRETGECIPKRKTLAERLDCSEDTVDRAKKELIAKGALKIEARFENGKQQSNVYILQYAEPDGGAARVRGGRTDAGDRGRTGAAPRTRTTRNQNEVVEEAQGSLLGASELAPKPKVSKLVKSVSGKTVTDAEYLLALDVLGEFNRVSGKRFSGKEWLIQVIGRIRENPEMTLEGFGSVVEQAFQKPWWGRSDPTPAVVFSGKAFDIAKNATPKPHTEEDDLSIYDR